MNDRKTTDTFIDEPLKELAWLVFETAEQSCDPTYGCVDYHKFWSVNRLLTTNGAAPRGLEFFAKNLAAMGADGDTARILLAGSADTGLPTLLANSAIKARRVPSITVVDRCPTPLAQIAELAKRTGLDITTVQGELDQVDHNSFDAAITHNVMLFNNDAARQDIYNKIAKGLKTGGRLLSTETICDSFGPRNHEKIERHLITLETVVGQHTLDDKTARDVLDAARTYYSMVRRVAAYPEQDMRRHVATAGLSLLSFDTKAKSSVLPKGAKAVMNSSVEYAFIASEKPD